MDEAGQLIYHLQKCGCNKPHPLLDLGRAACDAGTSHSMTVTRLDRMLYWDCNMSLTICSHSHAGQGRCPDDPVHGGQARKAWGHEGGCSHPQGAPLTPHGSPLTHGSRYGSERGTLSCSQRSCESGVGVREVHHGRLGNI